MRKLAGLLLLLTTGCSTSPVADFLDFAFPPRKIPPGTQVYGGVDGPQPAPPPGTSLILPAPPASSPAIPVPPVSP